MSPRWWGCERLTRAGSCDAVRCTGPQCRPVDPDPSLGVTGTIGGDASSDPGETVWLVDGGAALVALGCLLVAAGAISSAIFGGRLAWPHSAEVGTIIRGTLADPAGPAAAW